MMLLRPAAGFAAGDSGASFDTDISSFISPASAPTVPGCADAPIASGMFSPLMCLLSDADIIAGEERKQERGSALLKSASRVLKQKAPDSFSAVRGFWM